jgi:hypothetical protein
LPENNMKARPEIAVHLIAAAMERWLNILRCPLLDIRVPTLRARRNFRALVRKYPEIATALGYTETLSFPSPLHGLTLSKLPPLDSNLPPRENKPPEPPESPTVANNSVPCQVTENHPVPQPPAGAPRHLWTPEDEVL